MFALFMDTGLIPFYIFIALYSNQNHNEQPGTDGRWTSLLSSEVATTTLMFAAFIASIVLAGLHLVSVGIDLYLIVVFRKIANLPPDMNPLEDNLTGSSRRRSQKHKYKDSNATFSSVSTTDVSEMRKPAYFSGSTLSVHSTAKEADARVMPFGHSRMDSNYSYSPHNPNSARLSRQQFDSRQQYDNSHYNQQYDEVSLREGPPSGRTSRQEVGDGHRSRAGSVVSPAKDVAAIDFGDIPPLPPIGRPDTAKTGSFYSARGGSPDRVDFAPSNAVVQSQQTQGLLNDNWYVLDDEAMSDLGTPRRNATQGPYYDAQPTLPRIEHDRHDSFEPQPLKMNPPTPPPAGDEYPDPGEEHNYYQPPQNKRYYSRDLNAIQTDAANQTAINRSLTVTSDQTASSSVYSESAPAKHPNNATPKGKYYGDLASATRGVRGAVPLGTTHFPKMSPGAPRGLGDYGVPTPQQSRSPSPPKGRVISRTGADIADLNPYTLRGRRDVSGKVAEEGRGGPWR